MAKINQTSSYKRGNFRWLSLVIGIIYIIIGILMFRNPVSSFYTLCKIAGILLIISGTIETYLTFSNLKKISQNWLVFSSIIDLGIGLILVLNPKIILVLVTLLISLLFIYQAIFLIQKAVKQKSTNPKGWKWILGIGVLLIIATIILIAKPEIVGAAVAIWLGLTFLAFGIYRIILFFKFR